MGYVILRTQKLKNKGSISRSLKHSFRAQDTPNADPDLTPENTHIGADSVGTAMDAINERLNTQPKIRKNAVLAIEYLITGSPEILNEKSQEAQDKYFDDALDWMKERHGEDNVVYAGIHRDETTPHLYAYVVPIDERGKLNCRAFLGGSKALNEMQTNFAEKVGKKHDLERGIEGSKAKHKTIKKYYAEIQKPSPTISLEDLPKRHKKMGGLMSETDESYAKNIALVVLEKLSPELEKAKMVNAAKESKEHYEKAREQMGYKADKYAELTEDLDYVQCDELTKKANEFRGDNFVERAEKEEAKKQAIEQEKQRKILEQEKLKQERERLQRLEREKAKQEREAKRKERELARQQRNRARGRGDMER